jgi:hypothetical protein
MLIIHSCFYFLQHVNRLSLLPWLSLIVLPSDSRCYKIYTVYAACLASIDWRAWGLAPTNSSTLLPFLKTKKVGIARTPSSAVRSGSSSTSNLTNWMLSERAFSSESLRFYCQLPILQWRCIFWATYLLRMGEMALQGPHHVAKQSIRTALSVVETRSLNSFVLSDQFSKNYSQNLHDCS